MPATASDPEQPDNHGKGRPTPSRKEAEAARRRPLVPADRKLAARQGRAAAREARDREYQAMRTGDERHLPARDKGPERRWIRDYIDARWNLLEFALPVTVVGFAGTVGLGTSVLMFVVTGVLYAYFIAAAVDGYLATRRIARGITAKFGADRIPRGFRLYAASRAFQIRRLRMPKPQVARGEFPS